jgi:hypothetical protein
MARVVVKKYYDELINIQLKNEIRPRVYPWQGSSSITDTTYKIDRINITLDGEGGLRFAGPATGKEEKELVLEKIRNLYVLMGKTNPQTILNPPIGTDFMVGSSH